MAEEELNSGILYPRALPLVKRSWGVGGISPPLVASAVGQPHLGRREGKAWGLGSLHSNESHVYGATSA